MAVSRALMAASLLLLVAVSLTHARSLSEESVQRFKRQLIGGEATCTQMDLVFVLDSSGSIGEQNWKTVLNFTKSIIANLTTVGPYHTQVAVLTYATQVANYFYLNAHHTHDDLYAAIDQLPWKDEETNTSGALWYLHSEMFAQRNGARPRAPRVAILITDGKSNRDANLTAPTARDVHSAGITVMSVGVGDERDPDELRAIASNASYIYEVDNFGGLGDIQAQISSAACDIPVECNRAADITFILDSSSSVGQENFEMMKHFISGLMLYINVDGDDNSNVGFIQFSDTARLEFGLDAYNTRFDLQEAIMKVKYMRGSTNTAEALRMLREDIYIRARGDRVGMPNIAFLFTDGGSNNLTQTLEQAMRARTAGITLVVTTVTTWINMNEVREIASDPDEYNVFQTTFNTLESIRNDIRSILCDQWNECQGTPCMHDGACYNGVNKYECTCPAGTAGNNCQYTCSPVDVVFAVDSSGSIGETNYYEVLKFIREFANSMNFDEARMGLLTFADDSTPRFYMNSYNTKNQVINAISFRYSGGTTNTASALTHMREVQFTTERGARNGVRRVGVIVTDGESDNRDLTFRQAALARGAGIDLISVAINMRAERGRMEVAGIASDPDEMNVMYAPSFQGISNFTEALVTAVCNSMNECASNPCQGGGVCVDQMNGYRCICPEGRAGVHCERECQGRADLVFVVDTSGSIRDERFEKVRAYIISVVKQLEIGQDKVRVGLIAFSDTAYDLFHLNTYNDVSDVVYAVRMMPYHRGATATARALQMLYKVHFNTTNGDRPDVPNYAVMITDGESTIEPENTLPEAIQARIAGVHIIVVAVGPLSTSLEIRSIASDPDEFNVYSVERFDQLLNKSMPLVNGMCDTVNECAINPCVRGTCINGLGQYICMCDSSSTGVNCERICTRRADVVFVLDASGSLEASFELALQLVRRIVYGLNFDGDRTQVGVVLYSSTARLVFQLNRYDTREEVLNAMVFTVDGQRTNTYEGIRVMHDDAFTSAAGDRQGDPNYAIFITDGRSNMNQEQTISEALRAQRDNIQVFAVGIGINGQLDRMEVNGIASDPDSEYAFVMQTAEELDQIANSILDVICA